MDKHIARVISKRQPLFFGGRDRLEIPNHRHKGVILSALGTNLGISSKLLLVKKEDAPDHPGTACVVGLDWIDTDMLKHGISQSLGLRSSCATAFNATPTTPTLLLDVNEKSVVSGVSECHYVALSYRFGAAAHFKLDGDSLDKLRQDLALDSPEIQESLPLTVRDAIALVEALGERYLWTDSLCPTQENPTLLGWTIGADGRNIMQRVFHDRRSQWRWGKWDIGISRYIRTKIHHSTEVPIWR